MRFANSISSLLVGALFATSAVGELTKVVRTAPDVEAVQHAKRVSIARRDEACVRSLERKMKKVRRGDDIEVEMGADASGSGDDSLDTTGLATCLGIAVVGDYDAEDEEADGDDRFLAHVAADSYGPAEKLISNVNAAKEKGLGNLRASLIVADPGSYKDEGDGEFQQQENDRAIGDIRALIQGEPAVETHTYLEAYSLVICEDKSITFENEGGYDDDGDIGGNDDDDDDDDDDGDDGDDGDMNVGDD